MSIETVARTLCNLIPELLILAFLGHILFMRIPDKGAFFARALVALVIATFLAHVNRIFYLYPPHLLFPSGHTTLSLGLAISLGMLRPWTLRVTLPMVLLLGYSLVRAHYHVTSDVIGAFPLVLVVYGIVHWAWRLPSDSRLLDSVEIST